MSLRNLRHLRSFSPLLQKAASHPPKAVFSRHWRQSGGGRGRGPLGDKDGGRRNIIAIWSQGVDKLGRAKPVKTSGRASDDKVEENQQEEKTGSGDSSFPRKDQEEEEEEEGRRKEKEISPTQDGSEGGEKEVRVEEVKVRVEAKAREKAGERITYKKFRISHHEIHPKAREERGEAAGAERRGGGPSSPSHRSYESGGYYELSPDDPMRDPMKGNLAGMTIERLSFIPAQKLKKKADEAPPKAGIVDVKASSSSSPPGKERNGEKSPILDGRGWVTEEDFVQPSASPYEIHDSVALPEEDADAGKKSPRARTSPGPQTLRGIKRRHQEGPRGKYGIDNQPILQAEWPKAPPKGTDYVEPQASFSQKSEAKEGTEGESGSGDGKEGDGTRWEDKAMQERRKEGFDVTRVSGEPSGASDNKEDHLEKQLGKGGAGVTSKLEDLGLTQSRKDLAGVKEYDEEEPIGGDKPTKLLPHEQATRGSNFAGGRPDLRVTDSGTEGAETERSSHLHPEFNAPIRAAQRAKEALERLNPWKRRDARKEDARRQSDWQDAVKESPESRVLPPESSSDRKPGRDKTAADSEFSPTWPKMKKKHEGEKQKDNGLVHLKGPSMAYRDELRQASAEEEDSLATPKEYDFRLKVEAVPTEHKRADLNNAKKTKKNHSEGSASTDASHVFEELRELEKAIDNVLKKVKASHTASSARPRGGDPGDKGSKSSSSSSGGDCCGDSVTQNDVCHDFGHEGPQKHHSVEAKPPILTSPTLQASLEPPVVPPQKEIKFDRIEKQSEDEGFDRPPFAALEEDVLSESVRDAVSTPHQKEKGKEVEQLEESAWRRLWSGWGMKLTFSNPFVAMGDPAEATVKKSDQIPVAVGEWLESEIKASQEGLLPPKVKSIPDPNAVLASKPPRSPTEDEKLELFLEELTEHARTEHNVGDLGEIDQYLIPLLENRPEAISDTKRPSKCCREAVAKAMAKTYFDWAKFKARKGLNASVSPDEMDGILWQRKHGGPSLKEDSDYVEYYYSLPLEEHSTRFASVIEGGTGSKKEKKKHGEGEEHDKEDDGIVYDDKVEDSPAHSDQMDEGTLKEEDGSARRVLDESGVRDDGEKESGRTPGEIARKVTKDVKK